MSDKARRELDDALKRLRGDRTRAGELGIPIAIEVYRGYFDDFKLVIDSLPKPDAIVITREELRAAFKEVCPEAWGEGRDYDLEKILFGEEK